MRLIVTLAALMAVAVPAWVGSPVAAHEAQDKGGTHSDARPPSGWWKIDRYKQELRLTAEQTAEIESIVQASRPRMTVYKEDVDRAQHDFRQLLEQPGAAEREVLKAAERLEMARYLLSKERTTTIVRIQRVLTPDQRRGLEVIAKRNDASGRR